ncbi:MAG: rhodanese-like domain-containing protein [Romboutsia sp.]|uniref:rhodanese-like domain-containing protein n=1 Tax=Romboutsia sp. TaxID=1965302 RepID=UPI003F3ED18C
MKINKNVKVLLVGAILTLTVSSLVGCGSKSEEVPKSNESTTQNQEKTYKNISGSEAEKIMKDSNDTLILDVRDAKEYNEGHIVDAINIPVDEVEKRIDELESFKDKTVLVYCKSGKRSITASEILVKNNFKDVSNVEDGVSEYEYDLVEYTDLTASQFEKMISENSDAIILDPRDKKDFSKGHIENSINIPLSEIESRLDELSKDKPVLIYCNVGRKSAEAANILQNNGFSKVYNAIDGVKEYDFKLVK